MTLGEKQELFSRLICRLMFFAHERGYEIRLGDFYRDHRVHGHIGESIGYGHRNSCHKYKLAGDLNILKDGKLFTTDKEHEPFGIYWESLHPLCRWGGRFNDGNHYSLEHNGNK
jgi:hypothetical protein